MSRVRSWFGLANYLWRYADWSMSIRFTQRPQNICRACGYTWYPRGKNLSAQCPSCGSRDVELGFQALLRALGQLIAGLVWLIGVVILLPFRLLWWLSEASANGTIALWNWATPYVVGAFLCTRVAGFRLWLRLALWVGWAFSVKDDLFGREEGETPNVVIAAKISVVIAISVIVVAVPLVLGMEILHWIRATSTNGSL